MDTGKLPSIDIKPSTMVLSQNATPESQLAAENLVGLAQSAIKIKQGRIKEPPYVKLYTKNTVEQFIKRYMIGTVKAQSLVLVSPFISTLGGGSLPT